MMKMSYRPDSKPAAYLSDWSVNEPSAQTGEIVARTGWGRPDGTRATKESDTGLPW